MDNAPLNVGDRVDKVQGYRFPGTVRAVFTKGDGTWRCVVEMDDYGLLHIFSPTQLAPAGR